MSPNYNVDDILEEIRRKREGADEPPTRPARDTYGQEPAPSPRERAPARGQPARQPQRRMISPEWDEEPIEDGQPSRPARGAARRPAEPQPRPAAKAGRYAEPVEPPVRAGRRAEQPGAQFPKANRNAELYEQPLPKADQYTEPYGQAAPRAVRNTEPYGRQAPKADPYADPYGHPAARPGRNADPYKQPDPYDDPYSPPASRAGQYVDPMEQPVPRMPRRTEQPPRPLRYDAQEEGRQPDPRRAVRQTPGRAAAPDPEVDNAAYARRPPAGGSALNPETTDFSLHFSLDEDTPAQPRSPRAAKRRAEREAARKEPQGRWDTREEEAVRFDQEAEEEYPARRPRRRARQASQAFSAEDTAELSQSRWQQSFAEQEQLEQLDPDESFASPEDIPYVEKDLKRIRSGLWIRLGIMLLLLIIGTYMAFSIKTPPFYKAFGKPEDWLLDLPAFLFPDKQPYMFLGCNILVLCISAIVCCNIVGAGFAALGRLRANSDTPAALAVLAALVQLIVMMFFPAGMYSEQVSLYFPVAMLVLLFTLMGKMMLIRRIERNFRFLISDREKFALLQIQSRDFAREFARGLGPEVGTVSFSAPADFIGGLMGKSYTSDYSDNFYCVAAPACFAGALLVGGVTAFLTKDVAVAVGAFTAIMTICAPFSSAIVPHLMLGRMGKWLNKRGAMIAGYESAEELTDKGAVILDEKDIFTGDSVQLHGMKVFAEKRIDEAILDAASVILSCNGLMSAVFLNMIGGNQKMLKQVDGLIYEDGMGVSAWVDGKRVLIGSRELMQNHEVECPSRDFEMRYAKNGRKVLYIANSGELSAMFVVSYNGEPRVGERLQDLERRGISLILYTTDPNVTSELVSAAFGVRRGSVRVLPAKLHPEYNYLTRPKEHITSGCAHSGGLLGVLQLVRASSNICHSVRIGSIVQLVGIVAGYGLVTFMSFTESLSLVPFYTVTIFNLCTMVATVLAANFGKG